MSLSRVVVDTDTGLDDAHALLYLAGTPGAEMVAITTVFGNARTDDVDRNVRRVLDVAGLDIPVAHGAEAPYESEPIIADWVHGRDGLGDIWHENALPRTFVDQPAPELLVELARTHPGELDLLLLGPLTNVGRALELEPDLFLLYRRVVVMGGVGPFPPLGQARGIDANVNNDPIAATRVFSAPRNELVMVGTNVTRGAIIDERAVACLAGVATPWADFVTRTLEAYTECYQHMWGRRVSCAHDALAAAVLLDPGLVTEAWSGPVNVVTDGATWRAQLMRTADGSLPCLPIEPAPETLCAVRVDVPAFVERFVQALSGEHATAPTGRQTGR